ncbi:hypothetical protein ACJIZ3_016292 [Penstemon smallii]|uniref:VQ domain-containing protein n=1 Tax=Penstemon smallii TaxID=265156 RepID=A0ABD3RQR1_9LAMI
MKPQSFNTTLVPSKLVMHHDSRAIFKVKPKIRIIHIVAPEIITTNVENFRDLVQKLTGKPAERTGSTKKRDNVSSQMTQPKATYASKPPNKNTELSSMATLQTTQRMKKESEEIFGAENSNAFLSFLGDVDCFIHDTNEFPLLTFRSSQMNTFESF